MKDSIRLELTAAQATFHALLDGLSEEVLQRPSNNPAWTNKQMLFHMALGFFLLPSLIPLVRVFGRLPPSVSKAFALLLNVSTVPFNWMNALGPRMGARVFTRTALSKVFDWVIGRIIRRLNAIPEHELQRGMYFPYKWDPLFQEYMRLQDTLRFPIQHFNAHLQHIAG
jgi:hypothetical protein